LARASSFRAWIGSASAGSSFTGARAFFHHSPPARSSSFALSQSDDRLAHASAGGDGIASGAFLHCMRGTLTASAAPPCLSHASSLVFIAWGNPAFGWLIFCYRLPRRMLMNGRLNRNDSRCCAPAQRLDSFYQTVVRLARCTFHPLSAHFRTCAFCALGRSITLNDCAFSVAPPVFIVLPLRVALYAAHLFFAQKSLAQRRTRASASKAARAYYLADGSGLAALAAAAAAGLAYRAITLVSVRAVFVMRQRQAISTSRLCLRSAHMRDVLLLFARVTRMCALVNAHRRRGHHGGGATSAHQNAHHCLWNAARRISLPSIVVRFDRS